MARFYGKVGFKFANETSPGVWKPQIVERKYYGDVNRIVARQETVEKVNTDLVLNNEISIVADSYAYSHYADIAYVVYMGVKWRVTAVQATRPRLLLNIGKVWTEDEEEQTND